MWLSTSKRGNTRKPYDIRLSRILFFYTFKIKNGLFYHFDYQKIFNLVFVLITL
jgi:hypothetical protein